MLETVRLNYTEDQDTGVPQNDTLICEERIRVRQAMASVETDTTCADTIKGISPQTIPVVSVTIRWI
jgi:hypothetical protein